MTKELQSQPRYQVFKEWLAENGVINPSVEYPVVYGKQGQLVGMGASRDIPPMTAFLYIPQELLINKHTIKARSSEVYAVIDRHPDIFETHIDAEYLQLIIYVMHE